MMSRPLFATALLLAVPLAASAQAIRCQDPATGKVLYTDQPCANGQLVVPARTEEELRQDAQAAQAARERQAQEREQARWREQQRLEQARLDAATRPQPSPAESADCRAARAEADFRARSNSATDEQIRTARYNAALACGQQPPADIVVVQPQPAVVVHPHNPYDGFGPYGWPPRATGSGFGVFSPAPAPAAPPRPAKPPRAYMDQSLEPVPVNVKPPSANR